MPYVTDLVAVANGDTNDDRMVRGALSRGWAIRTAGWRKALAREHAHLAVAPELSQSEVNELQSERWQRALDSALKECGRSQEELAQSPKSASWKRTLALKLRDTAAPGDGRGRDDRFPEEHQVVARKPTFLRRVRGKPDAVQPILSRDSCAELLSQSRARRGKRTPRREQVRVGQSKGG